jgi:lipid-binding SYLF domain-containing protein
LISAKWQTIPWNVYTKHSREPKKLLEKLQAIAGGGSGKGIAVNNKTKKETFMKMIEIQAGLGMGVKKFRLVWIFENKNNLDTFINSGWELGGQGTAAAQVSGQGGAFAGALSISPGVWLYQLTDDGLALELTGKGTKYYKDDKLN